MPQGIPLVFHLTPGEAAIESARQLARKSYSFMSFTFVYFRSSTRRRFLLLNLI